MNQVRAAATVVLLRDGPRSVETLLLRRSSRLGFFPLAWVFPGGRIDDADTALAERARGAVPRLPPEARPSAVAAVRECFEESGVWLGDGQPDPSLRARLNAREASLLDAPGLVPDLSRLRAWARWVTPVFEPRRFDTWFFVAIVGAEELASHDAGETIDSIWLPPAEIIADPERFSLAPPTLRTLEELAPFGSTDEVFAASAARALHAVCPRRAPSEQGGMEILLPGDPLYPIDDFTGLPPPVPPTGPTRIRFHEGRWWSYSPPELSQT